MECGSFFRFCAGSLLLAFADLQADEKRPDNVIPSGARDLLLFVFNKKTEQADSSLRSE